MNIKKMINLMLEKKPEKFLSYDEIKKRGNEVIAKKEVDMDLLKIVIDQLVFLNSIKENNIFINEDILFDIKKYTNIKDYIDAITKNSNEKLITINVVHINDLYGTEAIVNFDMVVDKDNNKIIIKEKSNHKHLSYDDEICNDLYYVYQCFLSSLAEYIYLFELYRDGFIKKQ